MELHFERCLAASRARDPRFDGRFFVAVKTTGIYCRPVCPARPPRRENMRFFVCAAAAEAAGFRACRRCRPDAAPGSAPWEGTAASVARALRLIDDGALDHGGVEALAERLGVTARHLRRLFEEHLGASPVAIAQTRRAHFARRLLDETALPVTAVAHAAGFRSLRRFHEVWHASFGAPPARLRRRATHAAGIRLRLATREPYDWDAMVAFLAPRAIAGVEIISPEAYRRALPDGTLTVRRIRGGLLLETTAPPGKLLAIVARVRRLFDVDADPAAIAAVLGRAGGAIGRAVRARPGVRVPGAFDPFETSVRVLLGQQVSVAAATTIAGRVVAAFGHQVERPEPGLTHTFPSAKELTGVDLGPLGMPRVRAAAIRELARAVAGGQLALDGGAPVVLLGRPGIGPWTAGAIAMRVFGDPDAFPDGDLVLRRAAGVATSAELRGLSERWRPYRAYAAMHLWVGSAQPHMA